MHPITLKGIAFQRVYNIALANRFFFAVSLAQACLLVLTAYNVCG